MMPHDDGDQGTSEPDELKRVLREGRGSAGRPRRRFKLSSVATFGGELRDDFRKAPPWQRGLLVFALALAGLFVTILGLALTDVQGDSRPSVQARPTLVPTREGAVDAPPRATFGEDVPTPVLGATAIQPVQNQDEPAVAATDPGPVDAGSEEPPAPSSTTPGPAVSTATPLPPDVFDEADAVGLFVSYYASAPEGHYSVNPASCNARPAAAGTWNVSCIGVLAGCARPECVIGLSACVVEATLAVIPGSC